MIFMNNYKILENNLQEALSTLQVKVDKMERKLQRCQDEVINLRLKSRIASHEKLHVVFICHRPQYWLALKSVFEAFRNDDAFQVTIVAIPYKNKGRGKERYFDEGAYEFFKPFDCRVINGYNKITKTWYDLASLRPDFVFFQAPYESKRPLAYKSSSVSAYAPIGYIHYAISGLSEPYSPITYRPDFAKNVSLHFVESRYRREFVQSVLAKCKKTKKSAIYLTGHPKLDAMEDLRATCGYGAWPRLPDTQCRVLWTPRWTMRENASFFMEYKDKLVDFFSNKSGTEFMYRPHPQAFREYIQKETIPEAELQRYMDLFSSIKNIAIDTEADYSSAFYNSDLLISDYSSLMSEYLFTGKPIVYCHRSNAFNPIMRKVSESFYWVYDWKGLQKTLCMLMEGEDPLREKRKAVVREEFFRPACGSGFLIKEKVKYFLKMRASEVYTKIEAMDS